MVILSVMSRWGSELKRKPYLQTKTMLGLGLYGEGGWQ